MDSDMAKVMSDEDHAKLVTLLEAMIPKVADLEHEIVAYQIAKDNLELRLSDADLDHRPDHPGYEVY